MARFKKPWLIYLTAATIALLLTSLTLAGAFTPQQVYASAPQRFKDLQELRDFINSNSKIASLLNQNVYFAPFVREGGALMDMTQSSAEKLAAPAAAPGAAGTGAPRDFSTTNIQVAGVDEADIVKNDGRYLYVKAGQKIKIVEAYPPNGARVLSSLSFDSPPAGLFVQDNLLVVFNQQPPLLKLMAGRPGVVIPEIYPPFYAPESLRVAIYNISDKTRPELKSSFALTGASYVTARMIGDNVYLVANAPLNLNKPWGAGQTDLRLPEIIEENGSITTFPASAIQHFDIPYSSYRYTMIAVVNLKTLFRKTNIFLTGATQQAFVSPQNIYLTSPAPVDVIPLYQKYADRIAPLLPHSLSSQLKDPDTSTEQKLRQMAQVLSLANSNMLNNQMEMGQIFSEIQHDIMIAGDQTLVQKFQASGYDVTFQSQAKVPGQVLNQYSMDEQDGYFRIATTTRNPMRWEDSSNNIFVYGPDLQTVGRLTGLAPGERIYSARFMGKRAYLVTFRETDPFFVVDLADPASPRILGYLKIPGFSTYLHPYDENHIIGIGKDTATPPLLEENGAAPSIDQPMIMPPIPPGPRPTGLKIALFDVTDPEHPKEISKYVLPDGTDSTALYDPKAFLFSKTKNLLALPVSSPKYYIRHYSYWQGAYIFDISLDRGIALRGAIDHLIPNPPPADNRYVIPYHQQYGNVQRILYINDVLYTTSDTLLKLNSLDSLAELKALNL